MANFTWITDDIASAETIKLCFYAYQRWTWRQVFSETLDISQLRGLYDHLNAVSIIKDATKTTTERFVEASDDIIAVVQKLESVEPDILRIIFDKFDEDDRIVSILSILSVVEAENLHTVYKYQLYRKELDNLKVLLQLERDGDIVRDILSYPELSEYVAGQPEKVFQNWIEKNLWIFWVEYVEKYDFRRIAFYSDADLLMKSMDGFLDLIELKRPKYDIFKYDASHSCYHPSPDLSKVIWQCLFYLQKMDEYKLIIETENPWTQIISPRIKIIAWRSDAFTPEEYKALRMLNSNLNHIHIITYDYLLQCWEQLLSQYTSAI